MNRRPVTRRTRHAAIVAMVAALAVAAAVMSGCTQTSVSEVKYHCPMHPTYVSDRPGDCPICGMRLVPIEKEKPAAPQPEPEVIYTCPMHPEVVSDKPGKCPECGMDLEPSRRPAAGAAQPATAPAAGSVPGMAAVEIGPDAVQLAGVQVARAVTESISRTIRTVGTVLADETRVRHVHTKIAGWVEELSVNFTGQLVRKGEPMLSIYSQELVASQEEFLRARQAAARFAASDLPEVRKGGEDLVRAARRRLELLDVPPGFIDELERTGSPERTVPLVAPASGFVTSKATFEGHQVEPGMELFTITDLSRVWIEADFYEYEAHEVHLGDRATIGLSFDPARAFAAQVSYIYPTLNTETRTLRVRFEAANPDFALKPGMFANVELRAGAVRALVIPDSAVVDTGERQVVFVAKGSGRFEPREIRVGVRAAGRAQVLAGLAAGDEVVVKANFLLDSESRLRAALAGATTRPAK